MFVRILSVYIINLDVVIVCRLISYIFSYVEYMSCILNKFDILY